MALSRLGYEGVSGTMSAPRARTAPVGSPRWLGQAACLRGGHRAPSEASVGRWGQPQCGDCEHRAAMRKCSGSSMRPTEVGGSLPWQPEAKETVSLGKPVSSGKHTAQHTYGGAGCSALPQPVDAGSLAR